MSKYPEVSITVTCPTCDEEVTVTCDVEPEEHNWGADADGNRGIYVPASVIPPNDIKCSQGHNLDKEFEDACSDYEVTDDRDEGYLYDDEED